MPHVPYYNVCGLLCGLKALPRYQSDANRLPCPSVWVNNVREAMEKAFTV